MEVEGECTEVFLTSFSLTFYIYYSGIFTLIQIMVCGNAAAIEVAARTMRAQNLTKFFKFRTNVRSSKFDFKSQISRRPGPLESRSSFSCVGPSSLAAAIRSSLPRPSCSSFAAPYGRNLTAHGRSRWTTTTNICSKRMFGVRDV